MSHALRRIFDRARLLSERYRVTAAEREFLRLHMHARNDGKVTDSVVLVEAVEDHFHLGLFARTVTAMRKHRAFRAEQIVSRSLRPGSSRSWLAALKSLCFYNVLTDRKWVRLYAAFCDGLAYRSTERALSRASLRALIHAHRLWKSLTSRQMLLELTVDGVKVGDLVYDSYLRFKPAATVELSSRYLWIVLWQTLRDLRAARACIDRLRPRMLVTTYSTYIQHGIAVRVALLAGVKVVSFGNFQEFCKELTLEDWSHTRNPDRYRSRLAQLGDQTSLLAAADAALHGRVSGVIDAATSYMRRSAYASRGERLPDDLAGSLVLFLHDFFDSPHSWRWMIFADFWDWATHTLDLARAEDIRIFVKPHPNQIEESKAVVRSLMQRYPDAHWLSTDVSNVQLADAGIACAVTIYGTVAHEMAYLGVPSISAGHNPHISFSFSNTARDVMEYDRLVRAYRTLGAPKASLRREAVEFYAMHNLDGTAAEIRLRETVLAFRARASADQGWLRDGEGFAAFSRDLDAQPAFATACARIADSLEAYGDPVAFRLARGIGL